MTEVYHSQEPLRSGRRTAPRRKLRALVVNPDEGFLAFAAEALHSFRPGFEVATARDAEQANEWLDTFLPDLLLLGLDPAEAATEALRERITGNERTAECRILDLSSTDSIESTNNAPTPRTSLPVLLRTVRSAIDC